MFVSAPSCAGRAPTLRVARVHRNVIDQPTKARQGCRFDLTRGAALAPRAHQELPEAVVQLLDVSEHAHPQIVRTAASRRPCGGRNRPNFRRSTRALNFPVSGYWNDCLREAAGVGCVGVQAAFGDNLTGMNRVEEAQPARCCNRQLARDRRRGNSGES